MATSGSFDTSHRISGSYNTYATFSWSQSSQSVTNNTTTISWKLVGKTASSYQYVYVYSASVTVNGTTTSGWSGNMYNGTQMLSGSRTISHNADGTKSFSASAGLAMYSSGSWYSGSGSWTLTTIPRASTPSLASSTFNIGDTITINTNRAASSFTHTLSITYGSTTTQIATGVGASTTYDTSAIADAMYAVIPSATSFTGTITCVTYNGSTNIGTKTCSYTAKAVESVAKPTFSDFTYADTNSTITAITGNNQVLVQGKSTLAVTVSSANKATANQSASMSSYLSSISGLSASGSYSSSANVVMTFSSSAFTPGTQALAVKAIDSRGFSTSVAKNVTVLAYAAPTVNATAVRVNNFENETTLSVSGSYSPLTVSGTAKNTVSSVQYRYKQQSTSTWSSWASMSGVTPASSGSYTTTAKVLDLANTASFDIQVKTTDGLGSTTVSLVVSAGVPIFRIGTDGFVYINEQPLMQSHIGKVIMSTTLDTAAKVAAIYGGTWEAWGAGRVPVGVDTSDSDFDAPNKTGGSKTVTLQIEQIPSHRHELYATSGSSSMGHGYHESVAMGANSAHNDTTWDASINVGGGQPHDNMSPYQTLYMWKRVS